MKFKALAAVGAAALLVSACGGTAVTSTDNSPAPSGSATGGGEQVELRFQAWTTGDKDRWNDEILPKFHEKYPNIKVVFDPPAGNEYDAVIRTQLASGAAGDVIMCRAFDVSLDLYKSGYLTQVNDMEAMQNFGPAALSAFSTDDGKETYCLPFIGSIHGFAYNKAIFDELGLEVPKTQSEFDAVLEAVKADGRYTPLSIGAADPWPTSTFGFENIGPNYWGGEEGRLALIAGTKKFTDPEFVKPFEITAKWKDYLPKGFEALNYPDAQRLFMQGKVAIYPTGSWEIGAFNDSVKFPIGFFKSPVPDGQDKCYTNFHTDAGIGINAASKHPEEAKIFLNWLATSEGAQVQVDELPGQIPLTNAAVTSTDPLLQEYVQATKDCETTIRVQYQKLSRGEPSGTALVFENAIKVLTGKATPQEAAEAIQSGLDSWYKPGQ